MSDLTADLLKLAKDEVKLDDDIAVRDADRLTVATDQAKVHKDEQDASTAARNVVNADKALAEATARVQAQQQVLAAAQAAGDVDEINLARKHLREAGVDRSAAEHHATTAHEALDEAAKTLRTDTDALHADQDKLAKDEKQVDEDGHEVAKDEHQVNHDLGLPEGTPIDGAPELDGHGGVVEPGPVVVKVPIEDGRVDDHAPGDPLDPAPAGATTGGEDAPTTFPVLAHDPDPGYSPDHEVFSHVKDLPGDAHEVDRPDSTPAHTSAHEPSGQGTHETAAPVEHESAPVSHEDSGHAAVHDDHDSAGASHADVAAHHG